MPFVIRYSGSLGNLRQTTIHTASPGKISSPWHVRDHSDAAGSLPDTRRTGWQIGLRTTVADSCHELDILVGLPVKRWDRFLPKRLGKEVLDIGQNGAAPAWAGRYLRCTTSRL
jgi:hypothetical protein